MALIGDVLVKFVADFAEFSAGMDKANAKLDQQGRQLTDHGAKLEGIAKQLIGLGQSTSVDQFVGKLQGIGNALGSIVKVGGAFAIVVASIGAAIKAGKEIQDYADAISKLQEQYKLSTTEAQAMQQMAERTGRTVDDLNRSLSQQQKEFLANSYKSFFGDATEQITKVAEASNRVKDAWSDLGEQAKVSLAKLFGDWTADALSSLADAIRGFTAALREAAKAEAAIKMQQSSGQQNPAAAAAGAVLGGDTSGIDITQYIPTLEEQKQREAEQTKEKIADLYKTYDTLKESAAETQRQMAEGFGDSLLVAQLENINRQIAETIKQIRALGGVTQELNGIFGGLTTLRVPGLPGALGQPGSMQGAGADLFKFDQTLGGMTQAQIARYMSAAAPPVAAGGGGGGGGKSDDDYLDAQTRRYEALQKAAEKAYGTIHDYSGTNIEDLQRQVNTQRQIDDILGKINAKWLDAHPAARAALEAAVTGAEKARAAQDELMKSTQNAIETQRKYGDGTAALDKVQLDLNKQLATGKLQQDAYNRAMKEGSEATVQAALAAKRYDDNLDSLAAGFEHAANAYARSNDLYSMGEQAFTGLTNAMDEGLQALQGQSSKTFGQIAADFADMLEQMALKAAASEVFKWIAGSIGGLVGGSTASVGPSSVGISPLDYFSIFGNLGSGGGRAGGGAVVPGMYYTVGESGPERFVPASAGTIVPLSQSGGDGGLTVNIDMTRGDAKPNDPGQAQVLGRKLHAAIKDVIANEQRPGGTLYRRSALA
jgi:hypothetical protein